MDEITDTFMSLLSEADILLQEDPFAEEVIVVETATGNRYHCSNHEIMDGDFSEEVAFIEKLRDSGDSKVCYLVAMWNPADCIHSDLYPVDLPSFHLREKLLALSSHNADTLILLLGRDGYGYKKLGVTMPPPQCP